MELVHESRLVARATERWLRHTAKHPVRHTSERVYVAGKVGDLADDAYYKSVVEKFAARERQMRGLGYEVVNPMRIVKRGTDWKSAMTICLKALATCDAITYLPDVYESRGGMIELGVAQGMGMKMVFPSKMNDEL